MAEMAATYSWIVCTLLLLFVLTAAEESVEHVMIDADDFAKQEVSSIPPQLLTTYKANVAVTGGYQSAIISESGEVLFWGLAGSRVFDVPTRANFGADLPLPNITSISLGGYHLMALDSKGRLYTWGRGTHGVLGHGDNTDQEQPQLVKALSKRKVKLIAAGYSHSVAVTDAGVYTWGAGSRGQLGTGILKDSRTPHLIKAKDVPLKRITRACAGGYHTVLLSDQGEVFTFGANSYGTLGHGTSRDVSSPTKIAALAGVHIVDISCGGDHNLALSKDGRLYSWGWGEKGQLGLGSTENAILPQQVSMQDMLDQDEQVISISAGGYATSFLATSSGRLYAFGWGEFGILGNGGSDNVLIPTEMSSLSNISAIGGGGYKHALALTKDHSVYAFGDNTFNQLGMHHVTMDNTFYGRDDITPTHT